MKISKWGENWVFISFFGWHQPFFVKQLAVDVICKMDTNLERYL